VKINVAAVEALMKKERQGETQETGWFPEFHPLLNANVLFCRFIFNLTLCMTKLRVLVVSFPDFTDISSIQENFSSPNGGAFFKVQEWQAFRFLYFFHFTQQMPFGCITRKRTKILFSAGALREVMALNLQGVFLK
jgi:hypothetical protein